jgi:hypothetical protein
VFVVRRVEQGKRRGGLIEEGEGEEGEEERETIAG